MKRMLLTCAVTMFLPLVATAQGMDVIGGPDGAQTVHHCGYLAAAPGRYTDSKETTALVEQKLQELGFLHKPGSGKYTKADKSAVRAFQKDAGIQVDGIVGPITASRLAYFSHPSSNVHRCYRNASPQSF